MKFWHTNTHTTYYYMLNESHYVRINYVYISQCGAHAMCGERLREGGGSDDERVMCVLSNTRTIVIEIYLGSN